MAKKLPSISSSLEFTTFIEQQPQLGRFLCVQQHPISQFKTDVNLTAHDYLRLQTTFSRFNSSQYWQRTLYTSDIWLCLEKRWPEVVVTPQAIPGQISFHLPLSVIVQRSIIFNRFLLPTTPAWVAQSVERVTLTIRLLPSNWFSRSSQGRGFEPRLGLNTRVSRKRVLIFSFCCRGVVGMSLKSFRPEFPRTLLAGRLDRGTVEEQHKLKNNTWRFAWISEGKKCIICRYPPACLYLPRYRF